MPFKLTNAPLILGLIFVSFSYSCVHEYGKPGSVKELITWHTYRHEKPDSGNYKFIYAPDSSLSSIQYNSKSSTTATSFALSKNTIDVKVDYHHYRWDINKLGCVTKGVDLLNKRHFDCVYDNNNYLSKISYFNDLTGIMYAEYYFNYKNGNLVNITYQKNGILNTLCTLSYYLYKKNTDVFSVIPQVIFQESIHDFSPYYYYRAYNYPSALFGKTSANLVQTIIVPTEAKYGGSTVSIVDFEYNLNRLGVITHATVNQNPYAINSKEITDIRYFYNMNDNLLDKSNEVTTETLKPARYKTLDEIKLALLDARNEKAELLLGKPDYKGQIMYGVFYYMVYLSKVNDNGEIKHLVICVDGRGGINENSPIYRVMAAEDGQQLIGVGNFAQWLEVSRNGLNSNTGNFNYADSTKNWYDVFFSRNRKVESSGIQ
jgi:hypothetical protein